MRFEVRAGFKKTLCHTMSIFGFGLSNDGFDLPLILAWVFAKSCLGQAGFFPLFSHLSSKDSKRKILPSLKCNLFAVPCTFVELFLALIGCHWWIKSCLITVTVGQVSQLTISNMNNETSDTEKLKLNINLNPNGEGGKGWGVKLAVMPPIPTIFTVNKLI